MASYEIIFKKSVAKDLRSLPNKNVKQILERIASLSKNPRCESCIKLSGQEQFRVRQGVYRIIYEIEDEKLIVQVIKVAHRSHVYKSS